MKPTEMAETVAKSVRAFVDAAIGVVRSDLAALRTEFKATPKPERGEKGADGVDGRDGREGERGEKGLDAIQIQVRTAIDIDRSYPKGTYATIKGGIWLATRATEGLDGWECIVRGIDTEREERINERTVKRTLVLSDGIELATTHKSNEMIYRGVWKDAVYDRGDVVTWDGSSWICNETTETRPGSTDGAKTWTLIVKRGAQGRDASK